MQQSEEMMRRANEKGSALILALILLLVLSIIAVSLSFLSQAETWSSLNYRLMSQARYGAESGLNKAMNHLIYAYVPPGTVGDPMTAYNMNVSPVTSGGNPVILSANTSQSSNYPVSAVQTAFNTAAQGTLANGQGGSMSYAAYATLLSMRQLSVYGSATPVTIQTWQITADGTISGVRNAQVQVSGILERQTTPVFSYAVFATYNGCSALTFGGGGITDSYDSSTVSGGSVTKQAYGGNVGTNGNLAENGNPTTIEGSLSTPRTGVGTCSSSNITAWTNNQGTVTGGIVELPQPITYPTPTIPPPGATDLSMTKNWDCPSGANAITGCSTSGSGKFIPPGSYGNINLTGGALLHLSAGTYNINSISEAGQSQVIIDSSPVIMNVAGNNSSNPIDLTGGGVANATLNPSNFQISYAGTGTINVKGGAQASALVYAPNATFSFNSAGGDWYGAIIAKSMTDMGGAAVHYDRRLSNEFMTVGNYMVTSFTWKKY
jgi:hypothetical protein